MPSRHVHWANETFPRDRLTRENLQRVPLGGALANSAFRRPDRLTHQNVNQVPLAGFHADTWSWAAFPGGPHPTRYARGRRWMR
jgi:hypothetical protein